MVKWLHYDLFYLDVSTHDLLSCLIVFDFYHFAMYSLLLDKRKS